MPLRHAVSGRGFAADLHIYLTTVKKKKNQEKKSRLKIQISADIDRVNKARNIADCEQRRGAKVRGL